ncbi:hypothetical protein PoB_005592300 [Plakobranchus ocellatus]|uniref:Uncharacterized protein n=1 Tax=Plakobranchus ocellatus TaxID=259542 RepID=A0AAV4CDC9_9GAST|nr:hypothetical protein PoB_005592300 [Plakobranchus ocellatus]
MFALGISMDFPPRVHNPPLLLFRFTWSPPTHLPRASSCYISSSYEVGVYFVVSDTHSTMRSAANLLAVSGRAD